MKSSRYLERELRNERDRSNAAAATAAEALRAARV